MANETQIARLAGGGVPQSVSRVALDGAKAVGRAQAVGQQMGRVRQWVGEVDAFVRAEAARRRGKIVPLPAGAVGIGEFEVAQWMPWAPEGDISVAQGWAALRAAVRALPRDKAGALSVLMDKTRPDVDPSARSAAYLGLARIFTTGALGVPRSPFFAAWLLVEALRHENRAAADAIVRLFKEQPEVETRVQAYNDAMPDLCRLVHPGRWALTFTNFGQAPTTYAYELNSDGTLHGRMTGMPGGPAQTLLGIGLMNADPSVGSMLRWVTDAIDIRGTWSYERRPRKDEDVLRLLHLDLRIEVSMPFGAPMSSTQQASVELQGWNNGVFIGHDQNGCEWLLACQQRWPTARDKALARAVRRGTPAPEGPMH